MKDKKYKYNVSIGAYFKNETRFLKEWVEYHLLIGVEHFYLYCNDIDPTEAKTVLQPYIDKGLVTFGHHSKKMGNTKNTAFIYNKIIHKLLAKDETKWLAFIDLDEFINLIQHETIGDFLVKFTDSRIAAVAILWHVFVNAEKYKLTQKLQLEAYTHKLVKYKSRPIRKCIIKPSLIQAMSSAHNPKKPKACIIVDEEFNWSKKRYKMPSNLIRLNHYHLKSDEDFAVKLTNVGNWNKPGNYTWDYYNEGISKPTIQDVTIQRFLPELKKRMGITDET